MRWFGLGFEALALVGKPPAPVTNDLDRGPRDLRCGPPRAIRFKCPTTIPPSWGILCPAACRGPRIPPRIGAESVGVLGVLGVLGGESDRLELWGLEIECGGIADRLELAAKRRQNPPFGGRFQGKTAARRGKRFLRNSKAGGILESPHISSVNVGFTWLVGW